MPDDRCTISCCTFDPTFRFSELQSGRDTVFLMPQCAQLREADPACTTVTEIATENGFLHFGRFAQDYRRQFGVLPSQTLGAPAKRIAHFG